ncbi:AbrB/MazE/SpoVT family DNA-binding domain-containing protein [soil metagenome]
MLAKVQKWGNSLAIRIPATFTRECGLKNDTTVELITSQGQIIVKPVTKLVLADMLAQINADNLHDEVDMGAAIGKEAI